MSLASFKTYSTTYPNTQRRVPFNSLLAAALLNHSFNTLTNPLSYIAGLSVRDLQLYAPLNTPNMTR
jgi:hypothetical protein